MLHTLKKGEYPEGHRYWSNATADLTAPDGHNIASFDIPFVQAAAAKSGRVFIYPYVIDTLEVARELWPDLPSRSMDSLRDILGIERTDAHRALADCYDELALLNAELSVIMQSYARKMDYCRSVLLRIAGEIAEEIGE